MDDDQLNDLKQFIGISLSQLEARVDKRLDGVDKRFDRIDRKFEGIDTQFKGVNQWFDKLERDMKAGFDGVGDAIEDLNNRIDTQNITMNRRLTKLERQAA